MTRLGCLLWTGVTIGAWAELGLLHLQRNGRVKNENGNAWKAV